MRGIASADTSFLILDSFQAGSDASCLVDACWHLVARLASIKQESIGGYRSVSGERGVADRLAVHGVFAGRIGLLQHISDWALYPAARVCLDDCVVCELCLSDKLQLVAFSREQECAGVTS